MPTIYVYTVQIISLTRLRLAEEAVFGSCEFRPKSAPPATSSPATDIRYGHIIYSIFLDFFMPTTLKLRGHIALGLSVCQ